jgi:hypothetical protein
MQIFKRTLLFLFILFLLFILATVGIAFVMYQMGMFDKMKDAA